MEALSDPGTPKTYYYKIQRLITTVTGKMSK
jgi:hypothetical protein